MERVQRMGGALPGLFLRPLHGCLVYAAFGIIKNGSPEGPLFISTKRTLSLFSEPAGKAKRFPGRTSSTEWPKPRSCFNPFAFICLREYKLPVLMTPSYFHTIQAIPARVSTTPAI